ncbi:DUF1566 domain-containing protein [Isoalcanivorax indicus]|uniref:Lcl C-terminal domain-containing protein n=1 Tax=Isoalcanivorax indicus TaxID=2202653 RepID=UPI0024823FC3|nr:DUF1566 domain-containing protein [Isoalcanivorax indicus]
MLANRLKITIGWLAVASGVSLFSGAAWSSCAAGTPDPTLVVTTPTADFELHDDGTATHIPTGLMWKRCAEGQSWNAVSERCDGEADSFTWQQALQHADASPGFAGHNDWRVPNIRALMSIVERCASNTGSTPSINAEVFPDTGTGRFWSASPSHHDPMRALAGSGFSENYNKTDEYRLRLVRTAD